MKGPSFSSKFHAPLSTSEEVSKYLQKAILQGELKPGARLIERDLSETLGVSRIPIREAFRILELGGLVKIIPRKGAQVTAFTKHEIDEIYTLRSNLVSLAAGLAARNIGGGLLGKMGRICQRMDEKTRKNDLKGFFPLLYEFHSLLAQAGGNQRLYEILEILGKQTIRYRYASLSFPGRLSRANAYQQQLMKSLEKRDGRGAARIARKSIDEGRRELLKHLSDPATADLLSRQSDWKLPDLISFKK